ncbi:MAG TPA: cyclic nucleotide-binding domain-containing protein [bacterium]|nr:cyclic nucleotide-binding domain-containing protein [bacterium]
MELRSIELFKQFTEEELDKFRAIIVRMDMKKGDLLFNEGDPGDALYIIYSGMIRVFKAIDKENNVEKSLALLGAGTYLGEMTLMDGTPRSASARAESETVVFKITRQAFIKQLHVFPSAAIRLFISFLNVLSSRLRDTNDELVTLYEIGKIVGTAPPLNEMLERILKTVFSTVSCDIGVVFIVNDITMKLEVKQAIGEDAINLFDKKIKMDQGIVGKAISLNETFLIEGFDEKEEFSGIERTGFEKDRMLIAPLIRKGRPFGAIFLGRSAGEKPFSNANLNLINAVASQASAAIESALYCQECEAKENFDRKFTHF